MRQDNAGGFNIYNSTMKNIGEAGVTMKNSASDAFVLDHIKLSRTSEPVHYAGQCDKRSHQYSC